MKKVWKFIFGSSARKAGLPRAEDSSRRLSATRRIVVHSQKIG